MAKITLTQEEVCEILHCILCDCVTNGYFEGYGIVMECGDEDYAKAKEGLINPSFEDVLIAILKNGKSLTFSDHDGDGENTTYLTMQTAIEALETAPIKEINAILSEEYDASDCDIVLQHILYKETIFG